MRSRRLWRFTALLTGLGWVSTVAYSGLGWSQTSTQPDESAPAQSQEKAIPKRPAGKPAKSTARRPFNEKDKSAAANPNKNGVWHHFGEDDAPPKVSPRVSPSGQDFSGGRIVQPAPRPKSNHLAELERHMWTLVNHDRQDPANSSETKGGHAKPLQWNEKLAEVARAHSRDMMEQNFFDHIDPQGQTPAARINAAGIQWRALGENIATNGGGTEDAEDAFMNEPRFQHNHRANILNTTYTDVGIGIVQDSRGRYYITQDFIATPASPKPAAGRP